MAGRSVHRYSSACRVQQKYRVNLYKSTSQMCFETAILVLEQVKERATTLLLNIIATLLVIILVITNLMHRIFCHNKFTIRLYMFRAPCTHHQEVKIVLYSIWYHHTCRWPSGAQVYTLKDIIASQERLCHLLSKNYKSACVIF